MVRRLATVSLRLIPVLMCLVLTAGCGGDSQTDVVLPPPPPTAGPGVAGTIFMPNGIVAFAEPSLLQRLADLAVHQALALTGVAHVGRNVEVRLSQTRGTSDGATLATTTTNDLGQYQVNLPSGASENTCPRFIVAVGSGNTLTRALVFSSGGQAVDISYASEAAVRMFFAHVAQGADLCSLSLASVPGIVDAIGALPVSGNNAFEINNSAFLLAVADPTVRGMVDAAFGTPTPVPTFTKVGATRTPTIVVAPTNTFTRVPTNTQGSATNTPTLTVPPTLTRTPGLSPTPSVTLIPGTQTPTRTATRTQPPPTATNTQQPTATNTQPQVPTATNTQPQPPTATSTSVTPTPTNTQPLPSVTPTSATGPVPSVDIGSASGAPGTQVTVRFSLASNGFNIQLISPLQVRFNNTALTIAADACTSLVAGKNVQALFPQPDLLSVFFGGGTAVIPSGDFMQCNIGIASGTAPGDYPLTFVQAGMTDGISDIDGTGTSGSITVTGAETPTVTAGAETPTVTAGVATPTVTPGVATPTITAGVATPTVTAGVETPTATAAVATPTVTPTGPAVPRVDIGSANGAAGTQVSVHFALASNGFNIQLISPLQVRFNNTALSIAVDACTSLVAGKNVQALFPQPDLLSVFFGGGTAVIPSGDFMQCNIGIASGTAPGTYPLTFVQAGMTDGISDIDGAGTNGSITVP